MGVDDPNSLTTSARAEINTRKVVCIIVKVREYEILEYIETRCLEDSKKEHIYLRY